MSDITTNIKALIPSVAATTATAADGLDINGMLLEAQIRAGELMAALTALSNSFPINDANQIVVNGVILSLLSSGQLLFSSPSQSGLIATLFVMS